MPKPLSRYEQAERSLRRIRAWRDIGRMALVLWLALYAANVVYTMFTGRGSLFSGPWGLALGCCLAIALWGPIAMQSMAVRRLVDAKEPDRLGALVSLLGPPPENGLPSSRQERLIVSLCRMLARLKAADLVYLDDPGARELYRWITPTMGSHYPGFVLAVLEAVRVTRDVRALPALQAYCNALPPPNGNASVTLSVTVLFGALADTLTDEGSDRHLLRPARAPREPGALLRPAAETPKQPPEQLLRPAECPDAEPGT